MSVETFSRVEMGSKNCDLGKKKSVLLRFQGAGIRRVDHFNNAYMATLGWKVLKDENYWWVQIVKKKVYKEGWFFELQSQVKLLFGLENDFEY